ncbi:LysR family transcriptional regulator [Aliiroseovarius sp. 2305UL8-7]|uniref:LysR family transcriptional regulator n=1 Tax=Aliiroseovarius conchicola TaxID=3121637 RepID=UPI0035286FAF
MDWKGIPSLAALRAFEVAARHQSFSKAARELNVTHAAIGQHVRSLETFFSETLIVRQGRGIALTEVGRQLSGCLNAGFTTIAEGVEEVMSRGRQRPLQISVTPAFASNWLMPRIGEFWAKHPGVSLNINPSMELIDLRKDGFDLAIRYGDGDWPNVTSELLTDGDFLVVAPPKLVDGRIVRTLADLQDLPWLIEEHMMERRKIIEREGLCLDSVDLTILQTNALVLSATLSGLGVTVQPKSLVEREIAAGALVRLFELNQSDLGYFIVTVPDRLSPSALVFISWLRKKALEG